MIFPFKCKINITNYTNVFRYLLSVEYRLLILYVHHKHEHFTKTKSMNVLFEMYSIGFNRHAVSYG